MDLVDLVIRQSNNLPRTEFDLRRQMRRAAVSIPANIAEGYRRKRRRGAYQNHISIAMGSQGNSKPNSKSPSGTGGSVAKTAAR